MWIRQQVCAVFFILKKIKPHKQHHENFIEFSSISCKDLRVSSLSILSFSYLCKEFFNSLFALFLYVVKNLPSRFYFFPSPTLCFVVLACRVVHYNLGNDLMIDATFRSYGKLCHLRRINHDHDHLMQDEWTDRFAEGIKWDLILWCVMNDPHQWKVKGI